MRNPIHPQGYKHTCEQALSWLALLGVKIGLKVLTTFFCFSLVSGENRGTVWWFVGWTKGEAYWQQWWGSTWLLVATSVFSLGMMLRLASLAKSCRKPMTKASHLTILLLTTTPFSNSTLSGRFQLSPSERPSLSA